MAKRTRPTLEQRRERERSTMQRLVAQRPLPAYDIDALLAIARRPLPEDIRLALGATIQQVLGDRATLAVQRQVLEAARLFAVEDGEPVAYGQKTARRPLAVYRRKNLHSSTGLVPHFVLKDGCLLGLNCFQASPK